MHGMFRVTCLAALSTSAALAAAVPAGPQRAPDEVSLARLDGFALGLTQAGRFSGVVVVGQDDRIIFEKAYGKLDEASEAPATTNTRYNLASAGKMFTTVAVLQQVAAGRLKLDSRVGDVLKGYPNAAMARATVRQLLTHTSGAGDVALFGADNAANRARAKTVAEMVALHADRSPAFEPGTKQEYGNFAFVLLGRMVEVLSAENYESYLARHIFRPVGMTRTGFADCSSRAPDLAVGYARAGEKRVSNCATQPTRGFPAGGQVSTARDMFLFMRALRAGKIVPAALLREATKPHREFMGLGFFATDHGPEYAPEDFRWGHAGSSDGACTDVRYYPRTGQTVVVLTNQDPPACFPVANFPHANHIAKR